MNNKELAPEHSLRRYKCHKEVFAMKIFSIVKDEESGWIINNRGGSSYRVDQEYIDKHKPEVGGYFVRYDDSYKSYSPAKAFESGYSVTGYSVIGKAFGEPVFVKTTFDDEVWFRWSDNFVDQNRQLHRFGDRIQLSGDECDDEEIHAELFTLMTEQRDQSLNQAISDYAEKGLTLTWIGVELNQ